jgi:protoporphyrinogen oxidase
MKIAIIGAGFTGLSAAYHLSKTGHSVTIFEKEDHPGGLALGFKERNWDWTLEEHYHHWFTNDDAILRLANETNFPIVTKRPKTSMYVHGKVEQLDSPIQLLKFPGLPLIDRIRMGAVFAILFRFNPFWKLLEGIKITTVLPKLIGETAYKTLWEPQLMNKMGKFADQISLVWFWARIRKRTTSLAYPEGGYLTFANHLVEVLKKQGVTFHFSAELEKIEQKDTVSITYASGKTKIEKFDASIVTLPTFLFAKYTPALPETYLTSIKRLEGLGAMNLVLRLKKPFFTDNTYWLSICETPSPVMVVVEHTNFMDKKNYANEHIIYIGNYLPATDSRFTLSKEKILKLYDPLLQKLHPHYEKNIIGTELFKAPFAQPIIPLHYSQYIPSFDTPLSRVFLANMQQVYPWDRGTNYAVELGEKVANHLLASV